MYDNIFSITVTYNPDIDLLKRQLSSLSDNIENIIIVDNGSLNHNEIELLSQELCLNIRCVFLDKNYGLAYAQNVGIDQAINAGAEYILLLDQDSVLDKGFIKEIYSIYTQLANEGVKVGAVGPTFYDPNTNKDYLPSRYVGPFIVKDEPSAHSPVTFLIASGCFFAVDVYNDVGVMNEQLFVDYIDVDWSLRCKDKDYEVFITKNARMAHTIGDDRRSILGRTISIHSPQRRYFLVRNSFFMLRQHYVPIGYKIRELFFNFLRAIVGVIYSKERANTIKFIFKGIKDGISNKLGALR